MTADLDCELKDGIALMAERMRRAILTLYVLPDPDQAIRERRSHGIAYVAESNDWPDDKVKVRKFQPTAKDVDRYLHDLDWLNWLGQGRDGKREVNILIARAHKVPLWRLAQKYGKTTKTISRWYDGAIAKLYGKFGHHLVADHS